MKFRKVTISLPDSLYSYGMELVKKGFFSNFSDLVRSRIREEIRELHRMTEGMIKSVRKSRRYGKGKVMRPDEELDDHLEKL